MIKKTKRTRKYFAPQNEEGVKHRCDHPGCDKCGEYRAPKDRSLKEYYWFCLEHVQEYNAKWNYYDGETDDDSPKEEAERRRRFSFKNFGSRVKYNFGYDFVEFPDGLFGEKSFSGYDEEDIYLSEEERKYLKILEMKATELSLPALKKQYKKLVKKYHPDLNREDKDAEENFKQLSAAYKHFVKRLS